MANSLPETLMPLDAQGRRIGPETHRSLPRVLAAAERRTRNIAQQAPYTSASFTTLLVAAYLQGIMDATISQTSPGAPEANETGA